MKNTFFSCIITTLGLCLVGTEMKAQSPVQSASGIGEAGSRTAAQPAALGELPAKKKSLTDLGSEVLLLQRTEHFYTHLSVAAAYNSNAFYDYTQKGDWSLETAFDLGARTVLGGSFYLDAAFTMARSDYDTYESLSRNVLGGKAMWAACSSAQCRWVWAGLGSGILTRTSAAVT